MRLKPSLLAALACIYAFVPLSALAGRGCVEHELTIAELQSALQVAGKTRQALQRRTARFALIARVGSDISQHGLHYTHAGLARKRKEGDAWVVVHQLTTCASSGSALFVQGLGAFMLDDLHSHDVLIVTVPKPLAEHLETVFEEGRPHKIHDPEYSMISYPGGPAKYQNSNQWILELIAVAQAKVEGRDLRSRDEVHQYYLQQGFAGSVVRISPVRRAMAKTFAKNVRFDDHPVESRRQGRYEVVSVKSVVDYLQRTGGAKEVVTISGPYRRTDQGPETNTTPENDD